MSIRHALAVPSSESIQHYVRYSEEHSRNNTVASFSRAAACDIVPERICRMRQLYISIGFCVCLHANVVTDWATIVQPAIHNADAPISPASSQVLHTLVHLAIYDAGDGDRRWIRTICGRHSRTGWSRRPGRCGNSSLEIGKSACCCVADSPTSTPIMQSIWPRFRTVPAKAPVSTWASLLPLQSSPPDLTMVSATPGLMYAVQFHHLRASSNPTADAEPCLLIRTSVR